MARGQRRKKPPHPPPRCRICQSEKGRWTAEDAYPLWLRKRIHDWIRSLPPDAVSPGWEQGPRVMLKPVCERCQKRLNVVFESPASMLLKEMMDGSIIDLTPRQQVLVAAWAAKTALVLILQRTEGVRQEWKARLLRRYLKGMLKEGTPPANATVRIAYLSNGLSDSRGQFLPAGWPDRLPAAESIVSVISVPGLIVETVISNDAVTRSFIDTTKDDDRFVVVWPPHIASQRWPPRRLLALPDTEAIRADWGHTEWYGNFPGVWVPTTPEQSSGPVTDSRVHIPE